MVTTSSKLTGSSRRNFPSAMWPYISSMLVYSASENCVCAVGWADRNRPAPFQNAGDIVCDTNCYLQQRYLANKFRVSAACQHSHNRQLSVKNCLRPWIGPLETLVHLAKSCATTLGFYTPDKPVAIKRRLSLSATQGQQRLRNHAYLAAVNYLDELSASNDRLASGQL